MGAGFLSSILKKGCHKGSSWNTGTMWKVLVQAAFQKSERHSVSSPQPPESCPSLSSFSLKATPPASCSLQAPSLSGLLPGFSGDLLPLGPDGPPPPRARTHTLLHSTLDID